MPVEASLPHPPTWKANHVAIVALVSQIDYHHNAIARTLFSPTVKSNDFGGVIKVINVDFLPHKPRVTPDKLRRRAIKSWYFCSEYRLVPPAATTRLGLDRETSDLPEIPAPEELHRYAGEG